MGFNFFEPLTQFRALNKDHALLCVFDTVNNYNVILPDRTIRLPCILQFRCRFLRFPYVHKRVRGIFE